MKKALIITAIIVVVLVAAYFIRRATTQRFKVVKPLAFYRDSDLNEICDDGVLPVGKVFDNGLTGGGHISFEGNVGVITYNENGKEKRCYFDKSCVKPVIF